MYTTDSGGLFSLYIQNSVLLTSIYDLELLIRSQIFPTLNPTFYYTNCFVYVLEQYEVPSDKITVIRTYIVSIPYLWF